jgi:branched-subunit amino acid ABC-type transport system permease component
MNIYLAAAATLAFLVGVVHSILGEHLIFRRMRSSGVVPTNGGSLLLERHVRILWASWHVLTVLGWGLAVALAWLAIYPPPTDGLRFFARTIAITMLAGALLVLIGTKGKHPGWVGLLVVAVLSFLGSNSE